MFNAQQLVKNTDGGTKYINPRTRANAIYFKYEDKRSVNRYRQCGGDQRGWSNQLFSPSRQGTIFYFSTVRWVLITKGISVPGQKRAFCQAYRPKLPIFRFDPFHPLGGPGDRPIQFHNVPIHSISSVSGW